MKPLHPLTRARNTIMLALIANKGQTTRPETRVVDVRRDSKGVYHHKLTVIDVATPTIAANVSEANVFRSADKWGSEAIF